MLACIAISSTIFAQNSYQNPESATFSSEYNVYYISNYGSGKIFVVDTNYAITDTLVSGLNDCLGIHLIENTLYASCDNRLKGFDITTGECVFNLLLPVENWLDGKEDSEGRRMDDFDVLGFNSVTPLSGPQAGGPDLTPIPVDAPLGLSVTIISPLADFHTLMTT